VKVISLVFRLTAKAITCKAKAKDLTFKAKAKDNKGLSIRGQGQGIDLLMSEANVGYRKNYKSDKMELV